MPDTTYNSERLRRDNNIHAAQRILKYYMKLAWTADGLNWMPDNDAEYGFAIDALTDLLIDALNRIDALEDKLDRINNQPASEPPNPVGLQHIANNWDIFATLLEHHDAEPASVYAAYQDLLDHLRGEQ
jgi:hypothetical protein